MVDVSPPLPLPPPREPPSKKQEKTVDADKFHEEMHRRVQRVSETDEEQKKKRKHKQEAEEEEEPKDVTGAPTTPPGQVTPFSLTPEKKKVSPLDMQKGEQISPLASAQPTGKPTAPTPPQASFTTAPSTDEMEDDSGLLEESAFIETTPVEEGTLSSTAPDVSEQEAPPAPSPSAQPEVSAPPLEAPPPPTPPPYGRIETPTPEAPASPSSKKPEEQPEEGEEKKKGKAVAAGPPGPPPPTVSPKKGAPTEPKQATAKTAPAKPLPPLTEEKKEGLTTEEIETMETVRAEETGGFFEQYVEDKKGLKREVRPEEIAEEKAEIEGIAPIAPLLPSDYIEKEKKEEEEIAAAGGAGGLPGGLQAGLPPPAIEPPAPINPYANLPPNVMELFDRMVGTMTVMNLSGITETVVTLDAPKFASSVFFGSQIIIQEYSSAPQAFNIQLNGTPEAVALFQGNADDLMAAFQYGNYNFRVNRLETGLLGQKPLIKRKEPPSGGKEDQRGSKR